jgi:hypothetical protein
MLIKKYICRLKSVYLLKINVYEEISICDNIAIVVGWLCVK